MPRGYRLFIVAAFGCLILAGANHANPKPGEKDATHESIAGSLNRIASTYRQESERAHGAKPDVEDCGSHHYGSRADLCAQWKAADAAADSAGWAWASGLVGFGSLAGVALALGLAFHSNWIARDSAKRQLRAYLSVEPQGIFDQDEGGWIVVSLLLKNCGLTPAYNVKIHSWFKVSESPYDFDASGLNKQKETIYDSEFTFFPGNGSHVYIKMPMTPMANVWESIRIKSVAIIHFGRVEYIDAFGTVRITNFSHYHWGEELSDTEARRCRLGNAAT